ncbi:type II toxin-antitoxin system Phd/YefM family antitoxin [Nocardioides pantholopis]|uniref:type II toxin-antitoxin system Phd/YefM family antitoxin n=1 Tax=Nocardioides pantholopis TaxID=2483798 RepID=UPI000F095E24|nr:type II toxin-antitoxin system Phd/YefM family antitoxin [Nocardioides pantholopis]
MITTSLADFETRLSEYADRAEKQHERITVTRDGRPSFVIRAVDDLDSLTETLFWLSQPGFLEDMAAVEAFGMPPRV